MPEIKLTCTTCGTYYEKPESYSKEKNVFFRWSLLYCDKCRKDKERQALKALPGVIEKLSNNQTNNNMSILVFCKKGTAYKVTQKQLDRFKQLEKFEDKHPNDFYRGELAAEMGDLIKEIESKKPIILDHLVTGQFA